MLEKSVTYLDLQQKGVQRGARQPKKNIALRLLLEKMFGALSPKVQEQIEKLATKQVELLCEALFDFKSKRDLTQWLKQHARTSR
jgi:hypothetical protein